MTDAADIKDPEAIAAKGKQDILEEARTRYEMVSSAAEMDQRELGVEDFAFAQAEDGQWDDDATKLRKGRPCYTLNKIGPAIDGIVGNQRQSDITIRVRPTSGGANKETADTFNGLIRNIESVSSARNAYDNAFFEQLNSGYGGWRIVTVHNDDDTFDQDIRIRPINSAVTSLFFDPNAQEYDKRDALWAFLTEEMTKDVFKARYPDAEMSSFQTAEWNTRTTGCGDWFTGDIVRVAEYWRKVQITKNIVSLSDGRVIDEDKADQILDDINATIPFGEPPLVVTKTRTVKTFQVERYLLNGAEIIKGPEKWAGKYIPLVPVYGKVSQIGDKQYVRGIVRFAKDAQRVYNYVRSNIVEIFALQPKDPLWMTKKQIQGLEGELEQMNTDNSPIRVYNPDPAAPGPPQRSGAPAVQQSGIEIAQSSENDISATMGVLPQSQRLPGQSGVDNRAADTVIAQMKTTEDGTFIYYDNYIKSVEYGGLIVTDLLPKIYDGERQIRIIKPDGTEDFVTINETTVDAATGEKVIVNDLSQGKYDVAIDTGPAFATKRLEAANQLTELATNNPAFAALTPDLIAKSLDVPGSEELHERLRRSMIRQGTVEPTEEERAELGIDERQIMEQQITAELLPKLQQDAQVQMFSAQANELNARAEATQTKSMLNLANVDKTLADMEKSLADADNTDIESNLTAIKAAREQLAYFNDKAVAGIPITMTDHNERLDQEEIINKTQVTITEPAIQQGLNMEQ